MKRKNTEDLGVANVLLIGENPHAISIADNINATFKRGGAFGSSMKFNIVSDIESTVASNSWFNEFIFDINSVSGYNNIIVSSRFKNWMSDNSRPMEKVYMRKLLQAMNTIIIDISKTAEERKDGIQDNFGGGGNYDVVFDYDIPQYNFDVERDFLDDMVGWLDGEMSKLVPDMPKIRLVRSLCGKNIPYLGDVFGCLSGKKYNGIIHTNNMRFNVPILFDEFCYIVRGHDVYEIRDSIITRSNSAVASFFR